jgi:hypothetical protein
MSLEVQEHTVIVLVSGRRHAEEEGCNLSFGVTKFVVAYLLQQR